MAKNLKAGEQHLDDSEDIEVEIYDIEALCEMIYQGKLQDSKTVAALLAYDIITDRIFIVCGAWADDHEKAFVFSYDNIRDCLITLFF